MLSLTAVHFVVVMIVECTNYLLLEFLSWLLLSLSVDADAVLLVRKLIANHSD